MKHGTKLGSQRDALPEQGDGFCLQHIKSMTALDSEFSFDQSSVILGGNTNDYSIMTVGNRGEDTDSDLVT